MSDDRGNGADTGQVGLPPNPHAHPDATTGEFPSASSATRMVDVPTGRLAHAPNSPTGEIPGAPGPRAQTRELRGVAPEPDTYDPSTDVTPKVSVPGGPNRVIPPRPQAYSDTFAAQPGVVRPGIDDAPETWVRAAAPPAREYVQPGWVAPPRPKSKAVPVTVTIGVLAVLAAVVFALVRFGVLGGGDGDEASPQTMATFPGSAAAAPTTAAPTTAAPTHRDAAGRIEDGVRAAKVGDCAAVGRSGRSVTDFTVVPCTDARAAYVVSGRGTDRSVCGDSTWIKTSNEALRPVDVVLCLSGR
ncbi:hypothetical protein P0W64_09635 [Tsukamurella sp. 8F]|uniref:LppU/SCO3897 family protein n=1 Tax=unclassified Tsukamurella TaxID=2633480 RepID=UPI0023BA3434|nr:MULTISPECIES: hypothetical protein [unclassified Tsukamurella]MDF0529840.1 hypothetical protein [Tsukamurella sp. 8J]MDF0587032.1 hypothetical protein [Tsukamurella sp. 8F]